MALIICPECGHQVSDKADVCPGCGIKVRDILAMMQQASHITETVQRPQSVQPQQIQPQQAGMTRPQMAQPTGATPQPQQAEEPKKGKSGKLLVVSFIIALVICGTGYYFYSSAQQQKEQEDYEYAMTTTDPMVMQMYLARYGEAPQAHRDSVNARLTMLTELDNDWNNAVVSGTKSALLDYINNHPDSPHKGEAMNKIDSIDFAKASRANSLEAMQEYLKEHPDGKHANEAQDFIDEKNSTEVQPEELTMAKTACKHFFQAINSRNESKLLSTITDLLPKFLNITNANTNDVVSFMNKLYKDDITNMNWHILDDFTANKVKDENGATNIAVKFSAEQNIERTDASKEKYAKYVIEATILPDGKITKFGMKKVKSEE